MRSRRAQRMFPILEPLPEPLRDPRWGETRAYCERCGEVHVDERNRITLCPKENK